MIARMLKSGSFMSKVDYVTRVDHDHRIFTPDTWKILGSDGLIGTTRRQILASFELQAMGNHRISEPAAHITLSFAAEDRPKLSDKKMLQIAKDYMRQMGIDKTQWLLVRHYETDKPHCHIVYNIVGNDGKRLEKARNRYRNRHVCEALTKKYGLALPKREELNLEKLHGIDRAKAEIRIAAEEALSNAHSWNSFARELMKRNVQLIPKYRRGTTEMQGVSFQIGDYKVKGSDVGERFKFRNLDAVFTGQRQSAEPQMRSAQTPPAVQSVISDTAVAAVKATAELALDLGSVGLEGAASFIGGLFQPGPGHPDENESLEEWKLKHPRKRKRIIKKP